MSNNVLLDLTTHWMMLSLVSKTQDALSKFDYYRPNFLILFLIQEGLSGAIHSVNFLFIKWNIHDTFLFPPWLQTASRSFNSISWMREQEWPLYCSLSDITLIFWMSFFASEFWNQFLESLNFALLICPRILK